ncbi:MAG: type II toxin-antitoxin system VapC family toxin [Panacagrimonas sp.]
MGGKTHAPALAVDSSVIVAALIEEETHHQACAALLRRARLQAWSHILAETYSALTGGRHGARVPPAIAGRHIAEFVVPRLTLIELPFAPMTSAISAAHLAGARGGAIYDYLHLHVARESGARALYTLNVRHFSVLRRADDPAILLPE